MSTKNYQNSLNIFDVLRIFLLQQGLSQKIFAEKLSFPPSYISKIINNKCGVPKNFKVSFYNAFGFPLDQLPRKIENESSARVIEEENIYRITSPVAVTSPDKEITNSEKLNAAIIGLLPFLGFDNKKKLLKHIYETYFIPLGEEGGKEEEGECGGK